MGKEKTPEAAKTAAAIAATATLDEQLAALEEAERAIDKAFSSGKADRAAITQAAQTQAAKAVEAAGVAMDSDEAADEAMRLRIIAENLGDRDRVRQARKNEKQARAQAKADHRAATRSARQAWDAVRFSAPNRMGFLRAVQVIFALHVAIVLIFLVLTSRDAMIYDVTTIMDWIMVILEAIAFWMFINRYKIARPFVIGMAIFGLVVPAIVDITAGTFNPFVLSLNGVFYLFLILYFALSRRVKATLVNDITKQAGDYDKESFEIQRRGWPFIRNLAIYFVVFSVVGHWMEMGLCQFIIMGLVEGEYDPTNTMLWRDWLYPFPMEGAAVVIIALVLYPLLQWMKKKISNPILPYVLSFFANALTCSIIEFSMGLLVNADLQLWDYTNNFGNIMGQVCLQNTLAFGVAASIIAWFVYPLLERWIARVPYDIMNIVFIVVMAFGAIIWALYIIDPPELSLAGTQVSSAVEDVLDSEVSLASAMIST